MSAFKWEFYKDINGNWWWRKKRTKNGETIIASTIGFASRLAAVADARMKGYRGD